MFKVTLNLEGQEYGWFSIEEALKLVEPYTRRMIENYLRIKAKK